MRTVVLAFVSIVLASSTATAGPIDTALAGLIGTEPSWWLELVAVISALLGLFSAFIRDSSLPKWLSTIISLLSSNWGHAANDPEKN